MNSRGRGVNSSWCWYRTFTWFANTIIQSSWKQIKLSKRHPHFYIKTSTYTAVYVYT